MLLFSRLYTLRAENEELLYGNLSLRRFMRKVITVDGLAASGKTTIAKAIAQKLGFTFFSSGLIYRAVGLLCLQSGINPDDPIAVVAEMEKAKIEVKFSAEGDNLLYLNGQEISEKIFKPEVSEATSRSARHPEVRKLLFELQRGVFPGENIVAEGRDMGTVVFPDATAKFFVICDTEAVIDRRILQMSKGKNLTADQINLLKSQMKIEILERDHRDKNREAAPTVPAADAETVDNSSADLTVTLNRVYSSLAKRLIS